MRVTIVVPTYNERESIRPLIERIARLRIPDDTVLIVDDASPDGTGALAEELAKKTPSVFLCVLHRPRKEGLGAAYVAGFRRALADGAEVIVQMDADGSHDPAEIPKMIELLSPVSLRGAKPQQSDVAIPTAVHQPRDCFAAARNDTDSGADLVVGSRCVRGGRIIGWGAHRRLMSWSAQTFARLLLGFRTRDITSGFRAWKAEALRSILHERTINGERLPPCGAVSDRASMVPPKAGREGAALSDGRSLDRPSITARAEPRLDDWDGTRGDRDCPSITARAEPRPQSIASGYAFQEELLYRAEAADLHIAEHPITFRDRERGRSKLGWRDVLGFFRTCARLWWSNRDHRFAIWLGIALVLLTALPYAYGWWNTPAGYTYTGMHALAPGDMAVYGSYLEQVRDGRWTFLDLFTSEYPQRPRLDIFWLAAGLFTRATHLPAPLAFHVIRLLLIIPFTLFLSTFVTAFLVSQKKTSGFFFGLPFRTVHRTALLLLAFASGVGSVIVPSLDGKDLWRPGYNGWPIDFWVPESNTFLTLYQSPHLIVSLWLILYIVLKTLQFTEERERVTRRGGPPARASIEHAGGPQRQDPQAFRSSLAAGVASLALFQFHPFYIPTIFAVLLGWIVVESFASRRIHWNCVAHAGTIAAISAPSIAYHLWLIAVDPIMAAKAEQNLLFTPAWWYVVAGYGFLVPLAIGGVWTIIRRRNDTSHNAPTKVPLRIAAASSRGSLVFTHDHATRLLIAWLVVTVVLIFSPLTWQRRLTEGLHVALVLVATFGLFAFLAWLRQRLPPRMLRLGWTHMTAIAVAVPLLGLSTLASITRDLALFTIAFPTTIPRYSLSYPLPAVDAMRWIREHAQPGDVTFAVGIDGNFLPMYAVRQSALGHGVETTNFVEKYRESYALTGGTLTRDDTRAFLERIRARYVLVTDASRDLWHIDPAMLPGVTLAYQNNGAEVYELNPANK